MKGLTEAQKFNLQVLVNEKIRELVKKKMDYLSDPFFGQEDLNIVYKEIKFWDETLLNLTFELKSST